MINDKYLIIVSNKNKQIIYSFKDKNKQVSFFYSVKSLNSLFKNYNEAKKYLECNLRELNKNDCNFWIVPFKIFKSIENADFKGIIEEYKLITSLVIKEKLSKILK